MQLALERTPIPGLLVIRLPVHEDSRGWFKENWQREKMLAIGLPDFSPVQNNVSYNAQRGATRGIHAEPWDKLVSVASGRVFGAWVDMREGASFGVAHWVEIGPETAVFVPRGVGNAYQALIDGTSYTYLVNDYWRPGVAYPALHLGDEAVAIDWPIPLAEAEISAKDQDNPRLDDVRPMLPRTTLVLGCGGQLGQALLTRFPHAHGVDRDSLDITDPTAVTEFGWGDYDVVLNAAAYTAVDAAETPDGRAAAWAANAMAPATLARLATQHRFTLVHYSTDYVFDGTWPEHPEDEPPSPLGVYGQSKAAGDVAVGTTPRHYLLRTSWLVGAGHNFVRTMQDLASRGVSPSVVDDQVGRLTFTDELARATAHLLGTGAPHGTYNVTNGGDPVSWADIAALVFELSGRSGAEVRRTTTRAFAAGKAMASRPEHGTLDLAKLRATGFVPQDWRVGLEDYLRLG